MCVCVCVLCVVCVVQTNGGGGITGDRAGRPCTERTT